MVWPFIKKETEVKQHPAGQSFLVNETVSWQGANDRRAYIREGYQLIVIVYRAIREIVEASKSISFEL